MPIRRAAVDGTNGTNGKDGTNAIRLDLDNENDSMLYDGAGKLVSGNVTSQATLYDGATAVTSGVKYSIVCNGCTATIANGKVTVTAMSADTGSVTVTATYNGKTYTAILSLKKLVGVDKYDIVLSANQIVVDGDTGKVTSPSSIKITVYRTAQNGTRTLVTDLSPYSLTLIVQVSGATEFDATATYMKNGGYYQCNAPAKDFYVTLEDKNSNVLDHETIPAVSSGATGPQGEASTTYTLEVSPSVVSVDSNGYATSDIVATVYKSVGSTRSVATDVTITARTASGSDMGTDDTTDNPKTFDYGTEKAEPFTIYVKKDSETIIERLVETVQDGEQGIKGEDSVEFFFDPSIINFITDDSGNVGVVTEGDNIATPRVRIGNSVYTADVVKINSGFNCNANTSGEGIIIPSTLFDESSSSKLGIKIAKTLTEVPYYDSDGTATKKTVYIPYLSGYVDVDLSYTANGTTYTGTARLSFAVDFSTSYAEFYHDNSQFVSKISSLESNVSNQGATIEEHTSSITQLSTDITSKVSQTEYDNDMNEVNEKYTEIKQTAENISLSVASSSQNAFRNLLVNSYLRAVMQGTKSWRVYLTQGTTYVLSGCGFISNSSYSLRLQCKFSTTSVFYVDISSQSMSHAEKSFTAPVTGSYTVSAFAVNGLGSAVTLSDTNFFRLEYAQLEVGSVATAWTPNQQDDYGEMLTSLTPTISSGMTVSTIEKAPDGGKGSVYYQKTTTAITDCFYYNSQIALVSGNTYTLSFWVMGVGSMTSYLYDGVCLWRVCDLLPYGNSATSQYFNGDDGATTIALATKWEFVEITFTSKITTTADTLKHLLVCRLAASSYAYLYGVSLRKGGLSKLPTAIQEIKAKATGMLVEEGKFTFTSDNFEIQNNSGKITFSVDSEGNIVAANNAKFKNIYATNGTFEGTITATAGYIGGFVINSDSIGVALTESADSPSKNAGLTLKADKIAFGSISSNWFEGDRFASLGLYTNFMASTSRMSSVIIDNEDASTYTKYGTYYSVANGESNLAFGGNGNGCLYGIIEGYALNVITFSANSAGKTIDLNKGNRVLVMTSSYTNCIVYLPSESAIRTAMGIRIGFTDFSLILTILGGLSNNFTIRNSTDGSTKMLDNDGNDMTSISVGKGDTVQLLLVCGYASTGGVRAFLLSNFK